MANVLGSQNNSSATARAGWIFLIIGIISFGVLSFIFTVGIPPGCDNENDAIANCIVSPNPFLRRYLGTFLVQSRETGGEKGIGEVDIMTLLTNPSAYAQQASAMWHEPEKQTPLNTEQPYIAIEFPSGGIELSETSQISSRAEEYGVYARFRVKNSGEADISNMTIVFNYTSTEVNKPTMEPPVQFYCINPNEEENTIVISLLRAGETAEVRCEKIIVHGSPGDTYGIKAKVFVNYYQSAFLPIMFINKTYAEEIVFTGKDKEIKQKAKTMCSTCPEACCWINSYGIAQFTGDIKSPVELDSLSEVLTPTIKHAGDGTLTRINHVVFSIPNDLIGKDFDCVNGIKYNKINTYKGTCTPNKECECENNIHYVPLRNFCSTTGTCTCIDKIGEAVMPATEHSCALSYYTYNSNKDICTITPVINSDNGACPESYEYDEAQDKCIYFPGRETLFNNENIKLALSDIDSDYTMCQYMDIKDPLDTRAMTFVINKPTEAMKNARLSTYIIRADMSYVYVKNPSQGVLSII